MISLGSIDARKQLGVGFGGGMETEDTELEEGEACSYNNNDDDCDTSMDPDVSLSYIDEKLQDVLGHFQKDFEGGVSAENLGAKFGGYGSFLPAYQRSPVWSHPRTPPKFQPYNIPGSPYNLQLEGGQRSSVSSSTAPQSVSIEAPSTSAVLLPVSKASSFLIDSVKQEVSMPSVHSAEEFTSRNEPVNRNSGNLSDQKMLKVRIKMGSNNLSTQKNAAIYSGLGLDVSPSSSLDDSPSESEGMSHEPQDYLFQSPAHILQTMVSFPVHGALLLSPLPDDLIQLSEKEKLPKNGRSFAVPMVGRRSSGIVSNGSDSVKGAGKMLGEKKVIALERNETTAELKNENNKDIWNGIDVISNNGTDLDTSFCEELVSSTLKLPLLFNSYSAAGDTAKAIDRASDIYKEAYKVVVRDTGFSDLTEEALEPMFSQQDGWVENFKAVSAGKVLEDRKGSSLDKFYPREDGLCEGEKPCDSVKIDSNVSKGRMALNGDWKDPLKQKSNQRATSNEQEGIKLPHGKEHSSSEGKKKPKGSGSHGNGVAEVSKESLKVGSSSMSKNKESTCANECMTKAYPKAASGVVPPPGNGPISNAAHSAIAPAMADNWVCCDKCQKWRLLPPGKNPDDLPDKWLCTMLNWLPGMNQCSFSEDETTNAIRASFQVSAPETHSSQQSNPDGVISTVTWDEVSHPDHYHQNFGVRGVPTGGKELPSTMYTGDALLVCKDGPTQLSNSVKKSIQPSVTNGSLNDMNHSLIVTEPDFMKLSNSNDLAMEKQRKHKEKHRVRGNCSDGGDTKRSKMKGKRDLDRERKKSRTDGLPEDWMPDHCGDIKKVGPNSSNVLPTVSSGKNLPRYNDYTSAKGPKYDKKDLMQVSAENPKDEVQISLDDGSMDMKRDDRDVAKERKVKESRIYPRSLSNAGHHPWDSSVLAKEEFSENEHRKDKKARISRSEGKESSTSKGGRMDKKVIHRKNQQLGKDLNGVESFKRDSGSLLASVAATSSSSKVSGSHKTKANFHDAKGSPVESVSSSPMRVSKPDKLASTRTKFTEKEDSAYASSLAIGGLRRCSDVEDYGGSDRSGTARKEKTLNVTHHGSLESSALDFREKDFDHASGDKSKVPLVPCPNISEHHVTNGGADCLGKGTQYLGKSTTLDQCHNDGRQNENNYLVNGSCPRKSGKGSSLRSKDKNRTFNCEFDNDKVKVSDSISEQAPPTEVKSVDGKRKVEGNFGVKADENEDGYFDKGASAGLLTTESCKRVSQSNFRVHKAPDIEADGNCSHDSTSGRGKSLSLPPSRGAQNGITVNCPLSVSGTNNADGANVLAVNVSDGDNATKAHKKITKVDHPNGMHLNSSRSPTSNGHRVSDLDARSAVKKDSSSQAATNAVKEAKNLKHKADRLKNSGLTYESLWLYFEAALKFLHGASLMETCSSENTRTGGMRQSKDMYSSTAKLCEFCAREYEKSKDMAAAALAYKCMEVAYMRVIYSSHTSANRDRDELQMALQIIPPGESPSSSASDIDNLNHPTMVDKFPSVKGINSPQVSGSHVIAARNHPNFVRLLNFAQDVYFAMEASRKSWAAFAAANVGSGEAQCGVGISSVKTALDFNFQDVEGLLRLVRLAIQAINC